MGKWELDQRNRAWNIGRIDCRCCGKSSNVMYDQKSGEASEDRHGDIVLVAGDVEEARRMLAVIIGKEKRRNAGVHSPVSTDS